MKNSTFPISFILAFILIFTVTISYAKSPYTMEQVPGPTEDKANSSVQDPNMVEEKSNLPETNSTQSIGQSDPVEKKRRHGNKIFYGGSIGASFGSYTKLSIAPLIGYKVTPKLAAGVEILYEYVKDTRYTTDIESHNYGGSIFTRYKFIPSIYAHAEYKIMNYDLSDYPDESSRETVPFLFLGGGVSQPVGKNTWINFQVLFDVLQDDNSPYSEGEPFYSIGVGVGF